MLHRAARAHCTTPEQRATPGHADPGRFCVRLWSRHGSPSRFAPAFPRAIGIDRNHSRSKMGRDLGAANRYDALPGCRSPLGAQ